MGPVTDVWEKRGSHMILLGKPEEKGNQEDLEVDVNALLKFMVRKLVRSAWIGMVLDEDKGNWQAIVNTILNFGIA